MTGQALPEGSCSWWVDDAGHLSTQIGHIGSKFKSIDRIVEFACSKSPVVEFRMPEGTRQEARGESLSGWEVRRGNWVSCFDNLEGSHKPIFEGATGRNECGLKRALNWGNARLIIGTISSVGMEGI